MKWRRVRTSDKRGFALIIVAFLVGILVMLGAALVSMVQVESTVAQHDMRMRTARDNARYALETAIGELQKHQGPDRRVTALADAFRDATSIEDDFKDVIDPNITKVYHPFWTGSWNADTGAPPTWLITKAVNPDSDFNGSDQPGIQGDPKKNPADLPKVDFITLVGEATTLHDSRDFDVKIPLEEIRLDGSSGIEGPAIVGKYGYWVGDLNMKASYALADRTTSVIHDIYGPPEDTDGAQRRLYQVLGQYPWIDGLDNDSPILKAIQIDFQLRQRNPDSSYEDDLSLLPGLTHSFVRTHFHDYTAMARSVATNMMEGGLKTDLSLVDEVGDPFVENVALPYTNLTEAIVASPSRFQRVYSVQPKTISSDIHNISPVVSEYNINFALNIEVDEEGNGEVVLNYNGGVELWNVYTSSLELVDLRLRIDGLPDVEIAFNTEQGWREQVFNLTDSIGDHAFEIDLSEIDDIRMRGGQVITFTGPRKLLMGIGYVSDRERNPVLLNKEGLEFMNYVKVSDSDLYEVSVEKSSPVITLLDSDGMILGTSALHVTRGGGAVEYSGFPAEGKVSHAIGTATSFGYSWEMRMNAQLPEFWKHFDPRHDEHYADERVVYLDVGEGEFDPQSEYNKSHNFDYKDDGDLIGPDFDDPVNNYMADIPLVELPRMEPTSVALFRNARSTQGIVSLVGRSISDSILGMDPRNDLFDKYFFSTVPKSDPDWEVGSTLPNTHIRILGGTRKEDLQKEVYSNEEPTKYFLIEGGFNLNSTSIDAWASILSSIRLGIWEYEDGGIAGLHDFGDSSNFCRFAHSAEETWQGEYPVADGEDGSSMEIHERLRKGIVALSDEQISQLATRIVRSVRGEISSRNRPFFFVKNFLDEGVLQNAIWESGVNQERGLGQSDYFTTQFLKQADIMQAIGSFVTTRSDTFLIRAYGDAVNPYDESEVWARAYCEAVVQRMPYWLDPEDHSLGRKFEIIAFRWMTPEEI